MSLPMVSPLIVLPDMRALGRDNLNIARKMIKALSIRPFLHNEGMSEENYRRLLAGADAELHDGGLKLYYKV